MRLRKGEEQRQELLLTVEDKKQDTRRKIQDRIVTSEIPPNPPLGKGGNCVFPLEKGRNISCLESGVLSPESSKIAFVYSDRIHADIGDHVFPIEKYGLVRQRLIDDGALGPEDFVEPQMATTEDLLLVHTKDYVHDLTNMIWTERT